MRVQYSPFYGNNRQAGFSQPHKSAVAPAVNSPGLKPRFGFTSQYGTKIHPNRTEFTLWAPAASRVDLVLIKPPAHPGEAVDTRIEQTIPMSANNGTFQALAHGISDGKLYMYRLHYADGTSSKLLPDPRSRFQPEDVHGPSQIVDPNVYQWKDANWKPETDKRKLIPYRLHIGAFTPEGTLEAAINKLDDLKNEGYTVIELLPIMEFPGRFGWGYDMVDFFAVENAYGHPNHLKKFVDACHARGISVVLDKPYNHTGPEGNYLDLFDKNFFKSAWTPGPRFNWQNPAAMQFVKDNETQWLKEFHADGIRYDMAQQLADNPYDNYTQTDNVCRELTAQASAANSNAVLISEDGRTQNHITLPREHGGLGFWAHYNFSFHHRLKGVLTGKSHMKEATDLNSLSWMIQNGFPGAGDSRQNLGDAVNFSESHDEIANDNGGQRFLEKLEKLGLQDPQARYKLGIALKYLLPGIPRNFMGEEYGERSHFRFFADHSKDNPAARKATRDDRAGDPYDCFDPASFQASKLSWKKDEGIARLNRQVIHLRKTLRSLWEGNQQQMQIDRSYIDSGVLVIRRRSVSSPSEKTVIVINFSNYDYQGNYNLRFSDVSGWKGENESNWQGNWFEIFNTDKSEYGGKGRTNHFSIHRNAGNISLSPWSISVFHRLGKE